MLVKNQYIQTKVNQFSLPHYLELGYEVKNGQTISVKAEDLPVGSDKKVKVICDYCGEEIEKAFKKFVASREFVEKDSCYKCFSLKQKEVVQAKYNVDSTFQLEEVKEKSQQTILKKYGVTNVMKDPDIKAKMFGTIEERYGKPYPQQNETIQEKTKRTLQERYGVDNINHSPEIRKRCKDSFVHINGIRASKGQIELAKVLNGELNVNLLGYFVDIVLTERKIAIEYDGSGHFLPVKFGRFSQEEFDKREILREETLRKAGWKVFRVENLKDKTFELRDIEGIKNMLNEQKIFCYKVQ